MGGWGDDIRTKFKTRITFTIRNVAAGSAAKLHWQLNARAPGRDSSKFRFWVQSYDLSVIFGYFCPSRTLQKNDSGMSSFH